MRDSWQSPSQRPPFRWPSCNSGIALSTKKPTITPSSASTGGSWEWLGIKAMDINCGELLSKTVLDSKAAGYGHSVSPCKRKDTSKKLQDVIMSFTLYLLSIVKSLLSYHPKICLYITFININLLPTEFFEIASCFSARGCSSSVFHLCLMIFPEFFICHKAPVIQSYPTVFTKKILSAL